MKLLLQITLGTFFGFLAAQVVFFAVMVAFTAAMQPH